MMINSETKEKLEHEFSTHFENPQLFRILIEEDGLKTLYEYNSGAFTLFSSVDVANYVIEKLEKLGTKIVHSVEDAKSNKAKMSSSKITKVVTEPYDLVKHGYITKEQYEKAISKYNQKKNS